jgi:hypothetical protein
MDTPTCMTRPAPSIQIQDFGGAPLGTIQDFRDMGRGDMGLDIDQGIPIIIPVQAFPPADRLLVLVDQVPVLRLQRMHRHSSSNESK